MTHKLAIFSECLQWEKLGPGSLHGTQSTTLIPGLIQILIPIPGQIKTPQFQAWFRGSSYTKGGGKGNSREGSKEVTKKDGGARCVFFGSREGCLFQWSATWGSCDAGEKKIKSNAESYSKAKERLNKWQSIHKCYGEKHSSSERCIGLARICGLWAPRWGSGFVDCGCKIKQQCCGHAVWVVWQPNNLKFLKQYFSCYLWYTDLWWETTVQTKGKLRWNIRYWW